MVRYDVSLLSDDDLYLFNEGTHAMLDERLGAHPLSPAGQAAGTHFAVWAPNADAVSVIGDFNGWRAGEAPLRPRQQSGIWEGFVPGVGQGTRYKYRVVGREGAFVGDKADPQGFLHQAPPETASVVWDLAYTWGDAAWMAERAQRDAARSPWSIYELHIGSWARVPEAGGRPLTYRELAPRLAEHVRRLGFTHVEFLPVMEHPFTGSWGYQGTGYFAPTARYGTPQDFMYLVDHLHQQGIGVILDWVPAHFPADAHGLAMFDGTHLYEHADPRQGLHPDWNTCIFNYGRNEVRGFLLSSARFWLDRYHADGLRLDAVASMLYLDYSRLPGQWVPNRYGGRENLDAIELLRTLNRVVGTRCRGARTVAEESTAWPQVSRPAEAGGLGFDMKWDMGWMHDTLDYLAQDPVYRRYAHGRITFRPLYAFSENFVLPLSHDEVVHGKGSLLAKMPGDTWQRFANLRLLLGYQYAQPGKKLLFMGAEFAQWREWNHDASLDWHLLDEPAHAGVARWVADLNALYRALAALHEGDFDPAGFAWVAMDDVEQSVLAWLRSDRAGTPVLAVCNFTPVPRFNYRVGVPGGGIWREIANSDATAYGGSGHGNLGSVEAAPVPWHGRAFSLNLTLPPLGALLLAPAEAARALPGPAS